MSGLVCVHVSPTQLSWSPGEQAWPSSDTPQCFNLKTPEVHSKRCRDESGRTGLLHVIAPLLQLCQVPRLQRLLLSYPAIIRIRQRSELPKHSGAAREAVDQLGGAGSANAAV